jgi:DNA polymerase-3 subunit beta
MHIILKGLALREAVRDLKPVAGRTRIMSILEHVVLEADMSGRIVFRASDLGLTLRAELSGQVLAAGAATLPWSTFSALVDKLTASPEAELTLQSDGTGTRLTCARSRYTLRGLSPEDYPAVPDAPAEGGVTLPADVLAEALASTLYCADETAVDFKSAASLTLANDELTIYTCDGSRLARYRATGMGPGAFEIVVARRVMVEVGRLIKDCAPAEVRIVALDDNRVGFAVGNRYLTSRLAAGGYPNVAAIIPPSSPIEVDVLRAELLACVERALVVTTGLDARILTLTLAADALTVQVGSEASGDGQEQVDCDWGGAPFSIRLNGQYLRDSLRALPGTAARLGFSEPLRPVFVTNPDNPGPLALIMPLNLA